MMIVVSNNIRINDISGGFKNAIEQDLTFKNPVYATKLRLNIPLYKTKKTFNLMRTCKDSDDVILPYGFIDVLKNKYRIDDYIEKFNDNGVVKYNSNIKLRDYQEDVARQALQKDNGVIVMPAGSGKTLLALELTARLGKTCLWITHTQDLLNQSCKRAKDNFKLPKTAFGKITAGKVNIGTHITFATVQTLVKIDLDSIKNKFDIVIVDECHRIVPKTEAKIVEKLGMFQKVIESIPARYKYGLTATPHRSDGLFDCVYKILGGKIVEIENEVVADNIVPIEIRQIETDYTLYRKFGMVDESGTIVYAKVLTDLALDKKRNNLISQVLVAEKGNFNLILSNRIEHLDGLARIISYQIDNSKIRIITGNTKKEEREESIELIQDGKINYLFATYQLAREGLDIPILNRLFLAQPIKDFAVVVQSIGRVARAFAGKEKGYVYDFVDSDVGMFRNHNNQRLKIYKEMGYDVCNVRLRE